MNSPHASTPSPAAATSRRVLAVAFLTLFLDLVGFSIIFPLFPKMLEYYMATEGQGGAFGALYGGLLRFSEWAGAPGGQWGVTTLFGGVLASVYSLLQFVCAPVFGSISDRAGRRPVVLISVAGMFLSYVLWFFAGGFIVLVWSRVISGVMSANISTVSAIVADVTTKENRPKGMALIGMAFGLGFILGPALGGIASLVDLSKACPAWVAYGVNPYSMPALVAALLSGVNFLLAFAFLPETHKPGVRVERLRSINPIRLFHMVEYPGVTRTNVTYFLFLLAFSGMEFSLTFLAVERLGYNERQNAMMFLFIGIVLAAMQGGYVRRFSHRIGPRRMARHGLMILAPGLMLVALAGLLQRPAILYSGLFLMAVGSAQAMPCLTALASLYAPPHDQGRVLGVFRSLGALARALGPLAACLTYWRLGAPATYAIGSLSIAIPLFIARRLPPEPEHAPAFGA